MPFNLGGSELLVICLVAFLLFGAGSIPKFAKGIGDAIREFKKVSREVQEPLEEAKADANKLARTINKP